MLQTTSPGTSQDTRPQTVPILKYLLRAPGSGEPDVTFTQRWRALCEAKRLQEEHGYDTIVVPVTSHPPFNPWA